MARGVRVSAPRSSRQYVTIEEVYRRYGADLLRFLHGGHPHLNHQDCEDLLHQAVLAAVASIDQYDPARGSLRLWLFGILRNEVRMDLRRRRRAAEPRVGELPDVAGLDSPEAAEATREELAAVERALADLPFAERESLLAAIRTEGQATTEQVAERLGIAPGSVAVYRQRARERIRRALETREPPTDVEEGARTWRTRMTTR